MPLSTLATFAAATLLLLVIPGPAVLYIITRSSTQGTVAGLVSVAGIHFGTVAHLLAALAGLSAVLATSARMFQLVKLVGAAYLLWLGVASLRRYAQARGARRYDPGSAPPVAAGAPQRLAVVFREGAIVNLLNPKTAVFFLSIVPQFVDPTGASPTVQLLVLGAIFIALGLVSDSLYAAAGGWLGGRIGASARFHRNRELASAISYIGIGTATAFAGPGGQS